MWTSFGYDPTTDQLLIAQVHAEGAHTRLSLLDGQGHLLVQSDGRSSTDRDNLIAQHLTAGTNYLEVEGLAGASDYTLTIELTNANPPNTQIGGAFRTIAVGDFNGDGRVDLAGAGAGVVSVLLGDGDGTFQPPVNYAAGINDVTALVAGDFNGDGRVDLAGAGAGGVSVLLGDGDGTFQRPVNYAAGINAAALVAGDFNGDGRVDLADAGAGGVSVLLGDGDGTFQRPVNYAAGINDVTALIAGDFNGDGRVDLADAGNNVAGAGIVSVLLGNGDGTFQRPVTIAAGINDVTALVAGDFNGDGCVDLAVAGNNIAGAGVVAVLLGDGDGTFQPPVNYAAGTIFPSALVAGDFDGHGRVDLAITGNGVVSVLLGDGDGTFQPPVTIAAGIDYAAALVAGDFNGDGRVDLADAGTGVSVLLGDGDGTFQRHVIFATGTIFPSVLVAGDFNGDGQVDLAITDADVVSVLLGNGDGTFQPPVNYATGINATVLVAGDFNGDGRVDLAVAGNNDAGAGVVAVLLGDGDGTFQPPVNYATGIDYATALVAGDFNGDGRVDLAVAGNNVTGAGIVSVLQGNGDGTFQPPVNYATGIDYATALVAGDFNGDGRVDLAVAGNNVAGAGIVSVLQGNGDGTFQPPVNYATGIDYATALVAGDFTGAGRVDLAVAGNNVAGTGVVSVLLGDGDGTFQPPVNYAAGTTFPSALVAGDFDGDGRVDLAITGNNVAGTGVVSVLQGNGDGTFQPPVTIAAGVKDTTALVAGDFNGDGRVDLAGVGTGLFVKLNQGADTFADPSALPAAMHATPVLADLNGDGVDDLLVIDQAGQILWRKGQAGEPGSFEPPVTVNPDHPARDLTIVSTRQGPLIASVDAKDDAVSLYAYRGGGFARVGSLPTGLLPAQIESADLTGDGNADLVVRNAGDGTASLYLGDGEGGFTPLPALPIGQGASDIALADVDGSGRIDLVVTNQATGDVRIFFNRGDATFGPPARYFAGSGPYGLSADVSGTPDLSSLEGTAGVAVGTFTPGGVPDLVTINPRSNTLAVLDGLGDGAFANARRLLTSDPAQVVRVADLNGDGIPDLVLLGPKGVSIALGDGQGGFRELPTIDVGPNATGLSVADVNGDGKPDLLVGNTYGDVLVLLGNGDGTFQPYRTVDQQITLAVADLRGDGQKDVIYADQALDRVTVQFGGSGPPSVLGDRSQGLLAPSAVTLADLNGDGIPDLIVANSGRNDVLVYPGLGDGQFGLAHAFDVGTNPVGVTVADVNGDGIPDLVVADKGSNAVSVLLGEGRGNSWTLRPEIRFQAGFGPTATVVKDVTGNGIPDILVSDSQSNQVLLLRGIGQGFFDDTNPQIFDVGVEPGPLFVGNFTGRPGQLDLVTVNAGSNDLTLIPDFLQAGQPLEIPSGGTNPVAALAGDFNGDRLTDLLVANNGDGRLALFLGGRDGLDLAESMVDPAVPHPTALALDVLTGNLLQFYAGTEGVEAATLLAFDLDRKGGGVGGEVAAPVTPAVQQVARLQSLSESFPALIATLLSVAADTTPGESEATNGVVAVPAGSPNATGALPNQPSPPVTVGGGTGDDADTVDQEVGMAAQVVPATAVLTPLARFVSGLDEAFEKVRLDARHGKTAPGPRAAVTAQAILAPDAALERWSPVITTLGGPAPALVGGLGRIVGAAARAVDAALHALSEEGLRTPPPPSPACAEASPSAPPERDASPTVAAISSLGLMALARGLVSMETRTKPGADLRIRFRLPWPRPWPVKRRPRSTCSMSGSGRSAP